MQIADYLMTLNKKIARDTYLARFEGEGTFTAPGQFANIEIPGLYLRRPFSVCDWDESGFDIIYKVVGVGTLAFSQIKQGTFNIMTGLGNGFDTTVDTKRPLLVGGGSGVPPLYGLAKRLPIMPSVILGFTTKDEVFLADEFKALGCNVTITTVDGTTGLEGLATDAMTETHDYVFACGPMGMLQAIYEKTKTDLQFSFESRMGCGFGACMGCTCEHTPGQKRVCLEGPVFKREEIVWQTSR